MVCMSIFLLQRHSKCFALRVCCCPSVVVRPANETGSRSECGRVSGRPVGCPFRGGAHDSLWVFFQHQIRRRIRSFSRNDAHWPERGLRTIRCSPKGSLSPCRSAHSRYLSIRRRSRRRDFKVAKRYFTSCPVFLFVGCCLALYLSI